MFIFGDLLIAIAKILDMVLELYKWVIIICALISWVNPDPYNQIVQFLRSITEPVLGRVRSMIGFRLGPIDISTIVVIIAIIFLQLTLVKFLLKIGLGLGGG